MALRPHTPLPMLRQDLRIFPAGVARDGIQHWRLFDPLRNRFFQLGETEFALLDLWPHGTPAAVLAQVSEQMACPPGEEELETLILFLHSNQLLARPTERDLSALLGLLPRRRHWTTWLLHNYLFFRIPLANPDRLYAWLAPRLSWIFTRTVWGFIAGASVVAWYQITTQWDRFFHTFRFVADWEGVFFLVSALTVLKIAHEVGHGVTARYLGLRVPRTGIAFLVLWPVLYTDVNEIWRITDRYQRFMVSVAGIATEWILTVVATLVWSVVPEGPFQSAMFAVAAVGWVSSLFINITPFMRFDGYYLLSDWLDYPNLHDAIVAAARYVLHRTLGLITPPPDTRGIRLSYLAALGIATWIYRGIIFFGIAFLVFHVFTKVVGALLAAVELGWFIVSPVWQEIVFMMKHRQQFSVHGRRRLRILGLCATLLLGTPWSSGIRIPALLEEPIQHTVFARQGAWVEAVLVHNGDDVHAGDVMVQLVSPELNTKLATTNARIQEANARLTAASLKIKHIDQVAVLSDSLVEHTLEHDAIIDNINNLKVTAPVSGIVRDMPIELRPAIWVRQSQPLALVVATHANHRNELRAVGYLGETDYERVKVGQSVHFYPIATPLDRIPGTLTWIAIARAVHVDERALTQAGGGSVPTEYQPGTGREFVHGAYYRVEAILQGEGPQLAHTIVGELRIESAAYNPVIDACVKLIGLVREELAF